MAIKPTEFVVDDDTPDPIRVVPESGGWEWVVYRADERIGRIEYRGTAGEFVAASKDEMDIARRWSIESAARWLHGVWMIRRAFADPIAIGAAIALLP